MKHHLAASMIIRAISVIFLLAGSASAHPGHDHVHTADVAGAFSLPAPATAFLIAIAALAVLWGILHVSASRVSRSPDPILERNPS